LTPRKSGRRRSTAAAESIVMKAITKCFGPAERVGEEAVATGAAAGNTPWRLELGALAVVIALLNLPLVAGGAADSFAFYPGAVRDGEWWRLFTHPFVHVSWYHLLLDAAAFFMAYAELRGRRRFERFGFVAAAGAVSLLTALWAAPLIETRGLCGLSGIAHGLTAVVALELLDRSQDPTTRWIGLACFIAVIVKSLAEAVTGRILLESWHLGGLGTPIAVCHAGGVLGALTLWMILRRLGGKSFVSKSTVPWLEKARSRITPRSSFV
jgi:rhomboid family GlyGly-CTERM serine protease